MKKILVPCDFSKQSINAFEFAADIAERMDAEIILIHVIEPPVLNDTMLMPNLYFEEEAMKDLSAYAQKQFKEIIHKYKVKKAKTCIEFGFVNKVIIDYIKNHTIDLVVMGSKGVNGFKEVFIGSHAEKIVRHSTVPVIILKDLYKGAIKNIVFPSTLGLENQESFMEKLKELQYFFKAHLHIVWVNTPLNFTNDPDINKKLEEFTDRFSLNNYSFHVFNYATIQEGITQFTRMIDGDMLAMETHGRTGLAHLMNGSLTEEVVNHVNCPIWTYVMKEDSVLLSNGTH